MSVAMNFELFFKCASALPANISVLIRGDHGLGKSGGVWQLAKNVFKLPLTDKRMSQMSEGDVIGLPKVEDGVTKFLPPDWYKDACDNPRVLFLDELNRATPEVLQCAFQIVLDRTLNGHKLHPETRVYAAINTSASYQVNEIDPALLDRFWVVDLKPTVEEWIAWAKDEGGIHEHVWGFIQHNHRFLDPTMKMDPGVVEPSRRSWDRLNSALTMANVVEDAESPLFYSLARGFVGNEASIALTGYVKNLDKQITALNILNEFDKYKDKIQKLGQEKWNICIDKIEQHVKKHELVESQGENLKNFADCLPDDLIIVLWGILSEPGKERIDQIRIAHKALVKHVLRIFNDDKEIMQKVEKSNEERLARQAAAAAATPAQAPASTPADTSTQTAAPTKKRGRKAKPAV